MASSLPQLKGLSDEDLRQQESLIKQQIEAVQAELKERKKKQRPQAIEQIKALVAEYDITAEEVFESGNKEPPYRHPDDHTKTYGGRGPRPKWLKDEIDAGKTLEDFLVKKNQRKK